MQVLSTNGLKSVLLELVPAFERTTGAAVTVAWGSTATLTQEIDSGAAADLVILTAEAIEELAARGRVVPGSRRDLARSAIGLAVRRGAHKPDIGTPEALRQALLAARSVAHSRSGLSGIYFPTVLERLGIAGEMQERIVLAEPGTPVGELIAQGSAELGVQQISELLPVPGIDIIGPLPGALQRITTFSAGVCTQAKDGGGATALATFLAAECAPLAARHGLDPP
jgi:molybdate transport system substrate-binding protein